ncbi:MAG TPA: PIN domain-containing protein [Candidatus Thermoplasmatota archaeon]
MPILIDTGFFLALRYARDPKHERAEWLAEAIYRGEHGRPFVSEYIAAEILNFATRKLRSPDDAIAMMDELLGRGPAPWLGMAKVDDEAFTATCEVYAALGARKGLSFTDCSTLVLARRMGISTIASFDTGFDGLIERLS